MKHDKLLSEVGEYYRNKVMNHGATPAGVDWNSMDSQHLRFDQLLSVIRNPEGYFSLLDYGCGFGSQFGYMETKFNSFHFTGFDIVPEMIEKAKELHPTASANWITQQSALSTYDYITASGIFNVRQHQDEAIWKQYVLDTIDLFYLHSTKGFSFNMLTAYSDAEYMRNDLFYASPEEFFGVCMRKYGRKVALLHDYPLYEFTILVNK